MAVVPSRFNFIYSRNPNENVVYNTFSKALIVLDDDELHQMQTPSSFEEEQRAALLENGILVSDGEDELAFLKYFHYKTKFGKEALFLTIAPTLDCNFGCPYCYENRRKGKMSPEVQDKLLLYIQDLVAGGIKSVHITWYGGEPLLCFDIVVSLSAKIRDACEKASVPLKMDLVTNGYLLTPEILDTLDQIGITKIQITLDGLKEHHDVRRPLRDGSGTFDKIINNLRLFDDSPISVLVRMNVDNQNCVDFFQLKKLIRSLDNPNIDVYASPVEDLNKDTVNTVSAFMSNEEFEALSIRACADGEVSGNDSSIMDDRYCFCTAETEYCYVVDDKGDFYKCWDEVGRTEYRCFNILRPDEINFHQIAKFVACDPFSNETCKECVFLPLCFGGCKFQRAHLNKSVCGFTAESLKKYIETNYFND